MLLYSCVTGTSQEEAQPIGLSPVGDTAALTPEHFPIGSARSHPAGVTPLGPAHPGSDPAVPPPSGPAVTHRIQALQQHFGSPQLCLGGAGPCSLHPALPWAQTDPRSRLPHGFRVPGRAGVSPGASGLCVVMLGAQTSHLWCQ